MFNLSAIYAYFFFHIYIHIPLMRFTAKSFHSAGASGCNTKIVVEKNQKSFLIFGNSGEIWVSVFHVCSFKEVETIFLAGYARARH